MTQEQAKLLGCPFAFNVVYRGDGASNRNPNNGTYLSECLCVAAACMAWSAIDQDNGDCSLLRKPV